MSLMVPLLTVLVVLKLVGVIDWPWTYVLSPLWIYFLIYFVVAFPIALERATEKVYYKKNFKWGK